MTEHWLTREANCKICVRKAHGVCPGHPVSTWKGWCSDYVTPDEADDEIPVRHRRCADCSRAHDPDFCTRVDWEGAEAEDPSRPQWTCHLWTQNTKPGGKCENCNECHQEQLASNVFSLYCHLRSRPVLADDSCIDWNPRP